MSRLIAELLSFVGITAMQLASYRLVLAHHYNQKVPVVVSLAITIFGSE
jgi:hypothetical protein